MTPKKPAEPDPRMLRERALLKRLVISHFDFAEARQFLFKLTGKDGETAPAIEDKQSSKALRTALVVSYSRPFSGNRAGDGTQADLPASFLKSLTKEQRVVHDRILALRNQEFAHSDSERAEVRIWVGQWPDGRPMVSPVSNVTRAELPAGDLRILDTIFEHWHHRIYGEMHRIEAILKPGETF